MLVVRVGELVPEGVWRPRFAEINAWEEKLVESGTTLVKVALMVSHAEQGERLGTS